jgi:hypothetical protein
LFVEFARLRLRGAYAIVAAILILLVAPLYQTLALGQAYDNAILAIGQKRDFAPYVAWLAANLTADQTFRVIQALPLVLAFSLPGPLSAWLWPDVRRSRLTAAISGWIGFGVYILAAIAGFIASASAAASLRAANEAPARAAVAAAFGQEYALQSLLSRGVGGVALAVFLGMVGWRLARMAGFPRWVAYFSGLVAALEAANALVFLLDPLNVLAFTATLSLASVAAWLLVIGVALWQGTGRAGGAVPSLEPLADENMEGK